MEDKTENTLWNNPMVRSAMNSMSEEQKEEYRAIGEKMYGDMNFKNSTNLIDPDSHMKEATLYVSELLKSGLHPSDLNENEQMVMSNNFGEQWYEKWGYTKEDLKDIVTLKK